jgi:hypothetical protein
MDGKAVQTQISHVLDQVQASLRPVFFRVVARTGGNPILGTGQTITNLDTLVVPTPAVEYVKEDEVAGGMGLIQLGDYKIIFAGTVAESTLKLSFILYGTDVLKILSYQPATLGGVAAAWQVLARTVSAS